MEFSMECIHMVTSYLLIMIHTFYWSFMPPVQGFITRGPPTKESMDEFKAPINLIPSNSMHFLLHIWKHWFWEGDFTRLFKKSMILEKPVWLNETLFYNRHCIINAACTLNLIYFIQFNKWSDQQRINEHNCSGTVLHDQDNFILALKKLTIFSLKKFTVYSERDYFLKLKTS